MNFSSAFRPDLRERHATSGSGHGVAWALRKPAQAILAGAEENSKYCGYRGSAAPSSRKRGPTFKYPIRANFETRRRLSQIQISY
jgi:hypothetical protein